MKCRIWKERLLGPPNVNRPLLTSTLWRVDVPTGLVGIHTMTFCVSSFKAAIVCLDETIADERWRIAHQLPPHLNALLGRGR